ncbi:MAG: hypothetical protein RBS77_03785 [Candidatus Moranbacteria bacterium]|jgi:hypothetical protein|nr:hypothetical protein [Candidatus Moranbacteria bacterium]
MISRYIKEITLEEIRRILIRKCSLIDRELIVWGPQKDKGADCYFFALAGTPPKAYGIYTFCAEQHSLYLYNGRGKLIKNYYLEKEIKFD